MSADSHVVRLFLALWPCAAVRNQLIKLAQQLENDCSGRRIRPENLHLTLVFIGETEHRNIQTICQAATTIHHAPFNLTLDKAGFWKKAEVAVAGTNQCPAALTAFVQDLRRVLSALKIRYDATHSFTPHVTLLRNVRQCKLSDPIAAIDWPVTHWSLVQSRQTPTGSVYQSLADWALEPQE